ncbi:MAG TPA: SDR family oxidoreductase [Bacteroidia bacterium]|jgi:NAD(P)-dependent dehydrogenase (short-subunit alcohol dehydrogenase family)
MNIVVTGASRGIGRELVQLFAADEKVKKVFAVSRDEKKLAELENEKVIPLAFDLSKKDLGLLSQDIVKHTVAVDVLVNNAGALVKKPFEEINADDLELLYNVNVFSPFRLVQMLLPMMGKSARGHVVNISSMGGYQGSAKFAGLSAYSSSKGALAVLSECLAEELKDKNISVNCLCLGAAQTEMLSTAFPGYQAPLSAKQMAQFIADFSLTGQNYFNGKVLPVSLSTP